MGLNRMPTESFKKGDLIYLPDGTSIWERTSVDAGTGTPHHIYHNKRVNGPVTLGVFLEPNALDYGPTGEPLTMILMPEGIRYVEESSFYVPDMDVLAKRAKKFMGSANY